jgi:hypothetical protein
LSSASGTLSSASGTLSSPSGTLSFQQRAIRLVVKTTGCVMYQLWFKSYRSRFVIQKWLNFNNAS